ncbi:hypothetical protein PY74_09550 [Lacticaseibacillus rhamnosus]|nr:hypothetical protein PY66_08805 [Lacticaseibacillus rhamnosus]OAU74691.1 hypothetical protein PY74_09550 [Lacticaseibacillus rhamnosus]
MYRKREKYVNDFSVGEYAKQKHCDDYLKHAIIISVKRLWTVFLIVYYYYFQKLHARKGASASTDTPLTIPFKTVDIKLNNQKIVVFVKRLSTVFLIVQDCYLQWHHAIIKREREHRWRPILP